MSTSTPDKWGSWILHDRFGGDTARREAMLASLAPVRDRVLDQAALSAGDTVLDVGAGDGLIAFGALDRVAPDGTVILYDISQDLLDHSRAFAETAGLLKRCRFVQGTAADLAAVGAESVDAVTTRSVLIYLSAAEKAQALAEFHRVLKPGGRVSLFEPINRFGTPEPDHLFCGFDVTPVADLAARVRARDRPPHDHPLLDFDERDLLEWVERAGFGEVNLTYEAEVAPGGGWHDDWDSFLNTPGNPLDPSLGESIDAALTTEEADRFRAHLRPLVEGKKGVWRFARVYLWARKHAGDRVAAQPLLPSD